MRGDDRLSLSRLRIARPYVQSCRSGRYSAEGDCGRRERKANGVFRKCQRFWTPCLYCWLMSGAASRKDCAQACPGPRPCETFKSKSWNGSRHFTRGDLDQVSLWKQEPARRGQSRGRSSGRSGVRRRKGTSAVEPLLKSLQEDTPRLTRSSPFQSRFQPLPFKLIGGMRRRMSLSATSFRSRSSKLRALARTLSSNGMEGRAQAVASAHAHEYWNQFHGLSHGVSGGIEFSF